MSEQNAVGRFKTWVSSRMGHPLGVLLGKSAVDQLEQENTVLREALRALVDSAAMNEEQLNDLLMCSDYGESEALCKARQLLEIEGNALCLTYIS